MRVMAHALFQSLPALTTIFLFLAVILVVYATLFLQLYAGLLRYRCATDGSLRTLSCETEVAACFFLGIVNLDVQDAGPVCSADPSQGLQCHRGAICTTIYNNLTDGDHWSYRMSLQIVTPAGVNPEANV